MLITFPVCACVCVRAPVSGLVRKATNFGSGNQQITLATQKGGNLQTVRQVEVLVVCPQTPTRRRAWLQSPLDRIRECR